MTGESRRESNLFVAGDAERSLRQRRARSPQRLGGGPGDRRVGRKRRGGVQGELIERGGLLPRFFHR